jgi:hypothetical protein
VVKIGIKIMYYYTLYSSVHFCKIWGTRHHSWNFTFLLDGKWKICKNVNRLLAIIVFLFWVLLRQCHDEPINSACCLITIYDNDKDNKLWRMANGKDNTKCHSNIKWEMSFMDLWVVSCELETESELKISKFGTISTMHNCIARFECKSCKSHVLFANCKSSHYCND